MIKVVAWLKGKTTSFIRKVCDTKHFPEMATAIYFQSHMLFQNFDLPLLLNLSWFVSAPTNQDGRISAEWLSIKRMQFLPASLFYWGWEWDAHLGKSCHHDGRKPRLAHEENPQEETHKERSWSPIPLLAASINHEALRWSQPPAHGPPPLTPNGGDLRYLCWTLPKLKIHEQNAVCHCPSH